MLSALRRFTSSSQTFWGCDNTNTGGVLGVRIDGVRDFTGDTLAAAADYTGLVTATGLSPGEHAYQMLLDGAPVGSVYSFSTGPVAGDEFSVLFLGDTTTAVAGALDAIRARESAALVIASELHYFDGPTAYGGYADTSDGHAQNLTASFPASKAAYQADIRAQYRYSLTQGDEGAARQAFINAWPVFNQPGNHDLYISDGAGNEPGYCLYDAAHDAMFEYPSNGNPTASGTVDTAPDPVTYFNFVVGDVEIIVLDGLSYSDPFAVGYLGKSSGTLNTATMGEDRQVPWLKAVCDASTAKVIIVVPETMIHGADSDWNGDGLSAWFAANHTGKTIFMMDADTHQSFAHMNSTGNFMEVGYSPSAGVTSAKSFPNDTVAWPSDMFDHRAQAVGAQSGTTILVDDTTPFRVGRRAADGLGGTMPTILSIDPGVSLTLDASISVGDGDYVYAVDWPDLTDITNSTVGRRLANYAKVTRWPNGTPYDTTPHTEISLIGTYTGTEKFRARIRDGERTVRLYYTEFAKGARITSSSASRY